MLTPSPKVAALPEPQWLLPGWLYRNSITMLVSDPGSGKSALATALALAVARTKPFLGTTTTAPARVVFAALDAPAWDYARLLRKLGGADAPDDDAYHGALFYSFTRPSLTDSGMEDFLSYASWAWGDPPDLLIIDTVRKVHDLDENDARAMTQLMSRFRTITNSGTSLLLLHHTPKNPLISPAYRVRGSSVISGEVDALLSLTARGVGDNALNVTGRWVKGRGGDYPAKLTYKMTWSKTTMTFEGADAHEPLLPRAVWLGKTTAEVADALDISRQLAYTKLKKLARLERGRWVAADASHDAQDTPKNPPDSRSGGN